MRVPLQVKTVSGSSTVINTSKGYTPSEVLRPHEKDVFILSEIKIV